MATKKAKKRKNTKARKNVKSSTKKSPKKTNTSVKKINKTGTKITPHGSYPFAIAVSSVTCIGSFIPLQEDFEWYFVPPLVGTHTRFAPVSGSDGTVTEFDCSPVVLSVKGFSVTSSVGFSVVEAVTDPSNWLFPSA